MVKILGVDPGSRTTGYGLIDKSGNTLKFASCGVIKSTPGLPFPLRLKELYDGLTQVIDDHKPQCAAVEEVFFSRNPQSALKLGQARGALLVALTSKGVEVREFSARLIKQTVTGYGQASKEQIQQMVRVMLALQGVPSEDAADALAGAICLANHLDTY